MDVSDLVWPRWLSVFQHGDQCELHDRDGANLEQTRSCFIQTPALRCTMSVWLHFERPGLTSQFYQLDVLTLTALTLSFLYLLHWTRAFRCHKNDEDECQANVPRVLRWGWDGDKELLWPGIEQETKTPTRPENIHEEHTPARSHHFGVGCWVFGPSLRRVPEGSSTSSFKGCQEDAAMAHQKFFKMSAEIKQRWCYFKNADRPWLRFFFHNVVRKVRGSLQDDGCRRGCGDGREPETISMARFLGVHGLEKRCRFLGKVSSHWAWMFAVLLELILCVDFTVLGLNSCLNLCSRPEVRMEIVVAGPRPQWKMTCGLLRQLVADVWASKQTNTQTNTHSQIYTNWGFCWSSAAPEHASYMRSASLIPHSEWLTVALAQDASLKEECERGRKTSGHDEMEENTQRASEQLSEISVADVNTVISAAQVQLGASPA